MARISPRQRQESFPHPGDSDISMSLPSRIVSYQPCGFKGVREENEEWGTGNCSTITKKPPSQEDGFFAFIRCYVLGALATERKTRHADQHEKAARRLRH